jgi:hypothetical protein
MLLAGKDTTKKTERNKNNQSGAAAGAAPSDTLESVHGSSRRRKRILRSLSLSTRVFTCLRREGTVDEHLLEIINSCGVVTSSFC